MSLLQNVYGRICRSKTIQFSLNFAINFAVNNHSAASTLKPGAITLLFSFLFNRPIFSALIQVTPCHSEVQLLK